MLLVARLLILLCLPFLLAAVLSAQRIAVSQPTIWSSKPDAAAFDKIETDHLAAGRRAIDTLLAAKGPRTIENTLVPFDDAVRENNSAGYFAALMTHVHPDATFRDHATAMLTNASAAQTAIALNHVGLQRTRRARSVQGRLRHALLRAAPASPVPLGRR